MTKEYRLKQDRFDYPAGTMVVLCNDYDYGLCRDDDEFDKQLFPHIYVKAVGNKSGFTCPESYLEDPENPDNKLKRTLSLIKLDSGDFRAVILYGSIISRDRDSVLTTSKVKKIDFEKKIVITQNSEYMFDEFQI